MNKTDFSALKYIAPCEYLSARHAEISRARKEIAEARAEIERSVMVLKGVPRKHLRFITIAIAGRRLSTAEIDGQDLALWAEQEALRFQNDFKRIAQNTGRLSRDAGGSRFCAAIEMDLVRPSDGGRKAALMKLLDAEPLLTERAVLLHAHIVFSGEGHADLDGFKEVLRRAYPGNHAVFFQTLYKERTVKENLTTLSIYASKAGSERSLAYSEWSPLELDDEDSHRPAHSFAPIEPFFASLVAQAQVHLVKQKAWFFTNIRIQKKPININDLDTAGSISPSLAGTSLIRAKETDKKSLSPMVSSDDLLIDKSERLDGGVGVPAEPEKPEIEGAPGDHFQRVHAALALGHDIGYATWQIQQQDNEAAHRSAVLMGLKKPSPVPAALLKPDRPKRQPSTDERRHRRAKRLPRAQRRKAHRDAQRDAAKATSTRERMAVLNDLLLELAPLAYPENHFDEFDADAREAFNRAAHELSALHEIEPEEAA